MADTLPDTLRTLDQEATPGPWYVIRRGGAFFRPNAQGYTTHIVAAGLYSREEADKYGDVEGVTIHPLDSYRAEAMRTMEEAQRILSALGTPSHLEGGWQPIEQAERRGERRAIARLVNAARAIGEQAGVGGRETAGAIASYLATSPDEIAAFVDGKLSPVDFKGDWVRGGCLSWHAVNGKIVFPEDLPAPPVMGEG